MRRLSLACFIVLSTLGLSRSAAAADTNLSEEEIADGWISLFDGETFYGWRPAVEANFAIEDGTIVVSEGKVGLLRTTSQFSNYRLRVEFQADAHTNSGIFLHTSPEPQQPGGDCYELNIAPADNPFPTGSLVAQQKYSDAGHQDSWREFDVTVVGNQVTVKLDGQELYTLQVEKPLGRGYIGLQHNQGRVAFRKIRLKPLGLEPLFEGKDLTGWKSHPQSQSEFTVTEDGELHVVGGSGSLETTQAFADFVLQLQCRTNAAGLNSGVFFRCIPGSKMDGYESQIHNGMQEDDPTRPADCGTGGIFRRQNARRIVADDLTWFTKTLVACGPHVAVWINGYQVTDWSDTRKADPNPRRGLRLEAGSIMLQGHDPTTDISFRKISAAELAPRSR
jgi:hypothetical protein